TGVDVILGRDPSMTPAPLLDPSVSNLHARLIRQAGGNYLLKDQGSEAGTWVNYDEVSEEGRILSHGDLIHIGRVKLRFLQSTSAPPATIRIYPSAANSSTATHSQGSQT
ncbi:MAG: FHA domain-containing protein, partial [Anaerolineales bacterium]